MALTPVTKSAIAGALVELFDDRIESQINRSVVLLQLLPFALASGQVLVWDAEFGTESPATPTLADGNDVTDYNDDDIVKAKLDFGTYSEAFAITGKARAAALAAGNLRGRGRCGIESGSLFVRRSWPARRARSRAGFRG
jgi:hypothetical protein